MLHGTTSYGDTRIIQVCREVIKALPQALQGISYEEVLKIIKDGKGLELAMQQAFLAQLEKIKHLFSYDKTKYGWTLVENTEKPEEIDISSLELVPFLKDKETSIKGEELAKRARKINANLNQYYTEYLLEHQKDIPEDWKEYYLVFPGNIWRGSDGRRYVPALRWFGSRWSLRFFWLGADFDSHDRLLRLRD